MRSGEVIASDFAHPYDDYLQLSLKGNPFFDPFNESSRSNENV